MTDTKTGEQSIRRAARRAAVAAQARRRARAAERDKRLDAATLTLIVTLAERDALERRAGAAIRAERTCRQTHPGNGFYRARHQIGRPDFRFHDLRHSAATMAAISGATTKELPQFPGHSDIHVAMRDQEAVNDRKKELAQRMAALAGPAATPPSQEGA